MRQIRPDKSSSFPSVPPRAQGLLSRLPPTFSYLAPPLCCINPLRGCGHWRGCVRWRGDLIGAADSLSGRVWVAPLSQPPFITIKQLKTSLFKKNKNVNNIELTLLTWMYNVAVVSIHVNGWWWGSLSWLEAGKNILSSSQHFGNNVTSVQSELLLVIEMWKVDWTGGQLFVKRQKDEEMHKSLHGKNCISYVCNWSLHGWNFTDVHGWHVPNMSSIVQEGAAVACIRSSNITVVPLS